MEKYTILFEAGDVSKNVIDKSIIESSMILATVASKDDSMTSVSIEQKIGSFIIYPNSVPTSETKVNCMVWH